MATLPTEIITEILSRLPVTSLLRFKCVSKSWYSLIKNPIFIKLHLNQTLISNSDNFLLKWNDFSSKIHLASLHFPHYHPFTFLELHHPLETQEFYFLGSCNGVICICNASKDDVVLFNPLTRTQRKLPKDRIPLIFPSVSVFGFGYDSKSDDYKVLKIVQWFKLDQRFFKAQVYSVNNDSWKSVEGIKHNLNLLYSDSHGVLINQALHYMVIEYGVALWSASASELLSKCKFIACFDLETATFSLIDCPNYDEELSASTSLKFHLMELGGYLSVCVNYRISDYAHTLPPEAADTGLSNHMLFRADLWVMKVYGEKESWVRLFSICDVKSFRSVTCLKPVVYSKDGRSVLIVVDYMDVVWYDLESKKVVQLESNGLQKESYDTVLFTGSLVSFQDKVHPKRSSLAMKNNKRQDLDNFLSAGFKLKL